MTSEALIIVTLVAAGSFAGGVGRFVVADRIDRSRGQTFPWGTLVVNVSGAFAIGLCLALASRFAQLARPELWAFAVTGLLGSYTTVSAFSLQALALTREGRRWHAAGYVAGTLALGLGAVVLGLAAGQALRSGGIR